MVSSARNAPSLTRIMLGRPMTVEASTSSPTLAPSSRSQAGVITEEYSGKSAVRAESMSRSVHQACQPTRRADGVEALGQARGEQPDPGHDGEGVQDVGDRGGPHARQQRRPDGVRQRRGAAHGQADQHEGDGDGEHRQRGQRGGADRVGDHPRPRRRPGAPAARGGGPSAPAPPGSRPSTRPRPVRPCTAEPGATSVPAPTRAPGYSTLRAPTVARGPTTIVPDVQDVAVDPVPGQVHLRFDRALAAEGEQPGHRRHGVQVDPAAHPRARGPGRTGRPTGRSPSSRHRTRSTSRSAAHSRRCTAPPRG